MLLLGDDRNAFRGENGRNAHVLEIVLGTPAEYLAQLAQTEVLYTLKTITHPAQVLSKLLLREELHKHRDVHVLPAPLGIDEADR